MYKYLALSGGGIKGLSLLGGLAVLEKMGLLNDVETYVGSSIGGVMITMLTLGLKVSELYHITMSLELEKFLNISFIDAFDKMGLDDGDKIVKLLRSAIKLKASPDMTLKEHYELTGKFLVLTGSCLNDRRVYYFNKATYPNMKLIDALRVTTSLPLFFAPVKLDLGDGWGERVFIDGAVLAPNPAIYFENIWEKIDRKKLIVLMNDNRGEIVRTDVMLSDPTKYFIHLLNTLKGSYIERHLKGFNERVVKFNNDNIFSMKFEISKKEKFKLYLIGAMSTYAFMHRRGGELDYIMKRRAFELLRAKEDV